MPKILILLLGIHLLLHVVRTQDDEEYAEESSDDEGSEDQGYDEESDGDEGYEDSEGEEFPEDLEEAPDLTPTFVPGLDVPNMLSFESNTDEEHLRNFKKISGDLYKYEEEYSTCVKEIPDSDYTEQRIEECVGRNFVKVILDIKYEALKIMSRADTKVRKLFIEGCYIPAGTVEEFTIGCDLMERDGLDLMWNGMDFVKLLETNKEKYIREYAKIPYTEFRDLIDNLNDFAKEFFELMDEIDSHKEVTILRLKTLIDDRTKLIVEEAKKNPDIVMPPEIKHKIEITEELVDPNAISLERLPPPQILNSNPKDFVVEQSRARNLRSLGKQTLSKTLARQPVFTTVGSVKRVAQAGQSSSDPQQELQRRRKLMYQTNHYRMLNHGQNYAGLHSVTNPRPVQTGTTSALRPRLISSLHPSERVGDVKYKSVHSHFSSKNWLSKRFK